MSEILLALLKRYWQEIAIILLLGLLMRRWGISGRVLRKLEEIEEKLNSLLSKRDKEA